MRVPPDSLALQTPLHTQCGEHTCMGREGTNLGSNLINTLCTHTEDHTAAIAHTD